MIIRDFEDLEEYLPAAHDGVVNRLLAGRSLGDGDAISVWHGRFEPGGTSGLHVHADSVQIYVTLVGEMVVGDEVSESVLRPLATVVIAAGSPHFIDNRSDAPAEALVVSLPALR
ncbi:MAG TPA: cupin domain-containing protein [Acidimicrobiia bacterium]|nr:cupin domain-containing protein [Acidimicrobiia bacterium]